MASDGIPTRQAWKRSCIRPYEIEKFTRQKNIQEVTFRAGERVKRAHIDHKSMQYLYASGDTHTFMDMETYEQIEIPASQIEYELNFIKENVMVNIMMYQGEVLGIDLPNTLNWKSSRRNRVSKAIR